MQFTIKQKAENLQDYVIEQIGHSSTFTLADVERSKLEHARLHKEIDANIKIKETIVSNIEEHHPFVKDMSEEDLFTCTMYLEAKKKIKLFEDKKNEVIEAEKIQEEDLAEMYKQLPELLVSPIQPNE
jgi:NAD-specific glutamate dehydrogenase